LVLTNVSGPTGGLLVYADAEHSANSDVDFLLLVNDTLGDQLTLTFGDGHRHVVNHTALTPLDVLPDWVEPHLHKIYPYHTTVSHMYRRPGTYDVCLLTNDSSGSALELSRTTIAIDYEQIELNDVTLTTCVDHDGDGTILITSRRRLCDVVAEWSYDNQLFIDLVSFSGDQMPVWAAVDDDNATLYAATLTCRGAGRRQFVVGLTGRVYNTTYKFAETRRVSMRPVDVDVAVAARRVVGRRAAVLRVESADQLDRLHAMVVNADDYFAEYLQLQPNPTNDSVIYWAEMTLTMTLPVPERVSATLTGSKDGVCFVVSKTADVVDRSEGGRTDFEVLSHVDDASNAEVVLLAGRRVDHVRVSWGSDNRSFVRTVVDLTPDERPPTWLSSTVSDYYTATFTHQFVGSVPNTSMLTIVENADDSFAQVKTVQLTRRQLSGASTEVESAPLSPLSSSVLSRAGLLTSDCDLQPSDGTESSTQTQREQYFNVHLCRLLAHQLFAERKRAGLIFCRCFFKNLCI